MADGSSTEPVELVTSFSTLTPSRESSLVHELTLGANAVFHKSVVPIPWWRLELRRCPHVPLSLTDPIALHSLTVAGPSSGQLSGRWIVHRFSLATIGLLGFFVAGTAHAQSLSVMPGVPSGGGFVTRRQSSPPRVAAARRSRASRANIRGRLGVFAVRAPNLHDMSR